jgi:hypothetical protein
MRDAEIDETRFLAAGDDLDRMTERDLGLGQKLLGIACDAQRRGTNATDRLGRQAAQAFAEAMQAGQRSRLGGLVEQLVLGQATGEAHGFLQRVERIELVAGDARDFEAERVGAEVDGGESVVGLHAIAPKNR